MVTDWVVHMVHRVGSLFVLPWVPTKQMGLDYYQAVAGHMVSYRMVELAREVVEVVEVVVVVADHLHKVDLMVIVADCFVEWRS